MIDYVLIVVTEKTDGKDGLFFHVSFHHFRSAVVAAALLSTDSSQIWLLFLKGSLMLRGDTFYMNTTLKCSRTLLHS